MAFDVVCRKFAISTIFYITMQVLKSYKSSLNLNSYKLDTRGYEEKIKELIHQNAELKSILNQAKSKEGHMLEQLKNTKLEVNTLRNMLKSEYVVHENKCKNCASYSKQSIDRLISDIDDEKAKCSEFKKMYQNEVENKKQLTQYYQKKLHNILRDKDILVKKYEEKLKYLSTHNVNSSQQSIDSSTSIQNHFYSNSKTQQEITPEKNTQKISKKYPPPLPRQLSPRSNQVQSQKQMQASSSDSLISILTEPIIQKLTKMQISIDQLKTIPQVQRFAQSPSPPKNRFIKLLRDFPFECEDDDLIEESYKYIVEYLQKNRLNYSGENIINFLADKMQSK